MSVILKVKDVQVGNLVIVLSKIREAHLGLGNVIIVYDNGDRRTIDTPDAKKTLKEITEAIEKYYDNLAKPEKKV
ncbi:MAG: hypothetical protein PHR06_09560 [Candidatus Cloacimonetes bacterium]|nr:hypothetical protein [Candidatus Cloacimonadota bacterium]